MVKIPRISDRYKLSVGDVDFTIAPLTKEQKREVVQCTHIQDGIERVDLYGAQLAFLKYGVKSVSGVEYSDGEKFKLVMDGEGVSSESLDDLMNLPHRKDLVAALWQTLDCMPSEIIDPETGKKMEGVSLELLKQKDGKT